MSDARPITHRYLDPLDAVWVAAARRIGLEVVRSAEVFASTDGRGRLFVGTPETLDPDDSLAQMILHELCHSLVQGPEAFASPDWGLENHPAGKDEVREQACLRVQAELAAPHGLELVLAPTTEFRAFYERILGSPLAPADAADVRLARGALVRASQPPWAPHLERALEATGVIAREAAGAGAGDLPGDLPSLWARVTRPHG